MAKGAEERLRGTVAFGSLEKKRQEAGLGHVAAQTGPRNDNLPITTHPGPQRHNGISQSAEATLQLCGHTYATCPQRRLVVININTYKNKDANAKIAPYGISNASRLNYD